MTTDWRINIHVTPKYCAHRHYGQRGVIQTIEGDCCDILMSFGRMIGPEPLDDWMTAGPPADEVQYDLDTLIPWLLEEADIDESGGCPDAAAKHRQAALALVRLQTWEAINAIKAGILPRRKIPEVGDDYTPLFQSDLGDLDQTDWELIEITEVEYETSTPGTWSIRASDGVGYDCCWSEEFQIWCYNLG